jgi:hypothetical protein
MVANTTGAFVSESFTTPEMVCPEPRTTKNRHRKPVTALIILVFPGKIAERNRAFHPLVSFPSNT